MMTFGSLFAGIGGLDLGLERAGLVCRWQVEIDPWRRAVLERHWPAVPRWTDITEVDPADLEPVDLICGGFPCQDVSVAGKRRGLLGERSGLFFEYLRIVEALRPRYVLVENVPGLLSSHGGSDFGIVLQALADLGYGVAWRVLDSRYFGVPQRRRRVFLLGALPGGRAGARRAAQVLGVGESCPRHPPAGAQAGSQAPGGPRGGAAAPRVASLSGLGTGGPDDNDGQADRLVPAPLTAGYAKTADKTRGGELGVPNLVVTPYRKAQRPHSPDDCERWEAAEVADALTAHGTTAATAVLDRVGVRRLTTVECSRLQGFPDDWFGTPNEPPDGPRYRALGDAITVPVAEWVGRRLVAAGGNDV